MNAMPDQSKYCATAKTHKLKNVHTRAPFQENPPLWGVEGGHIFLNISDKAILKNQKLGEAHHDLRH